METTTRPLKGFDTETHLIDQTSQLPPLVCLSTAEFRGEAMASNDLVVNADPGRLREDVSDLVSDRSCLRVGQSVAFDLGVFASNYPDLLPAIFEALDAEQFSCTMIREKLLNLATHGDLAMMKNPDGSNTPIRYNMEILALNYLGLDLSHEKNDADAWRTNYAIFDNVPVEQWPADAIRYAKDDAVHPVRIWLLQEEKRRKLIAERGIDPFVTESFRVLVDFVLKLLGSEGVPTDPEAVAAVEKAMAEALAPEKMGRLVASGILRPAGPGQALKIKAHVEGCDKKKGCTCPFKVSAPTEESVNKKALEDHVKAFAEAVNTIPCPTCGGTGTVPSVAVPGVFNGCKACGASGRVPKPDLADDDRVTLLFTDPTDKFPNGQLSVTSDWLADYAALDPTLTQYKARQDLQKIVTTELPRMKLNGVLQSKVYPQYDCLKETGRTSSYGIKGTKDKPATAATFNSQNVDPRVRGCFVPEEVGRTRKDGEPEWVLWSCDLSQMELCTLAQACYKLFGFSTMRDKINAKIDLHAYTGAQLAFGMVPEFQKFGIAKHGNPTPQQVAEEFLAFKKEPDGSDLFKFYKHWRKFAKPVNLGFPGGLGAKTFVKYAAGEAYGVTVTRDEAEKFREVWKQTYPEMPEYFDYINHKCVDPHNKGWDEKAKEEYDLYCYDSPFGMHRAGCDYCACANGLGLQTWSADGALAGLISVVRACLTGYGSELLGPVGGVSGFRPVVPLMFIHDEIVGKVILDERTHDRMMEVRRLMIEGLRVVCPDVLVNANPCLMRRWNKFAEPVYGEDGKLKIWEPAKEVMV